MTNTKNISNGKRFRCFCALALLLCACAEVPENCGDGIPPVSQGGCPGGSGGGGGSSFTDSRDGKRYRTVRIGTQTWMAENLNYTTSNSWCYDDDPSNCTKYGRLYTWDAAMSACPSGWHLPSDVEWDILLAAVGGASTAGTMLKSTTGWSDGGNGADVYGFSALPGGWRDTDGTFTSAGRYGEWWCATEGWTGGAWHRFMNSDANVYENLMLNDKGDGLSARCIRWD